MSFNKTKFNRQRFNISSVIIADFTASLKGSGNIVSDIQLLKSIKTLLETKGDITSKLTVVLNVDGQFQADNDIYSCLTKVSQVLVELTASGLIESDTDIIINLSGQFGGGADLTIADPYIKYKLSYIILPTKTLLIDTRTKMIVL
jgi:hypothetical protein